MISEPRVLDFGPTHVTIHAYFDMRPGIRTYTTGGDYTDLPTIFHFTYLWQNGHYTLTNELGGILTLPANYLDILDGVVVDTGCPEDAISPDPEWVDPGGSQPLPDLPPDYELIIAPRIVEFDTLVSEKLHIQIKTLDVVDEEYFLPPVALGYVENVRISEEITFGPPQPEYTYYSLTQTIEFIEYIEVWVDGAQIL